MPPSGEPARLGDGTHESQCLYVANGEFVNAAALAQKHRVDQDELAYLCGAGRRAWDSIKGHFPTPRCEEEFAWIDEDFQIGLSGHPDVFSVDGDTAIVADWKSGFLWSNCEPQLRGYAWLIAQEFPEVRTVEALHLNIRLGEMEKFVWTVDELAQWWHDMAARIDAGREVYGPGYESCRYCHRFKECPAGEDFARQEIAIVADTSRALLPDMAVNAYERARFVEKVAGDIVEQCRTLAAQNDGELKDAAGNTLRLNRQKRDKISAKAGWKDMLAALTVNDVLDSMTVGKTKLLDCVRSNAPHRGKKKAADEFMERLRDAGAVEETFIEKLELRRVPKAVAQELAAIEAS